MERNYYKNMRNIKKSELREILRKYFQINFKSKKGEIIGNNLMNFSKKHNWHPNANIE